MPAEGAQEQVPAESSLPVAGGAASGPGRGRAYAPGARAGHPGWHAGGSAGPAGPGTVPRRRPASPTAARSASVRAHRAPTRRRQAGRGGCGQAAPGGRPSRHRRKQHGTDRPPARYSPAHHASRPSPVSSASLTVIGESGHLRDQVHANDRILRRKQAVSAEPGRLRGCCLQSCERSYVPSQLPGTDRVPVSLEPSWRMHADCQVTMRDPAAGDLQAGIRHAGTQPKRWLAEEVVHRAENVQERARPVLPSEADSKQRALNHRSELLPGHCLRQRAGPGSDGLRRQSAGAHRYRDGLRA